MIERSRRPLTPLRNHVRLVEVLTFHVPGVDGEIELRGARPIESVLVVNLEVGAHQGGPDLLPTGRVEHGLPCASEVARIPVHQVSPQILIVHLPAPRPWTVSPLKVRCREGIEEGRDGHGHTNLPSELQELEAHPCPHGVAPHSVGSAVRQLMVESGHHVRRRRSCGVEFLGLDELVTARKVDRQDLHVLLFLGPSDEGRARSRVLRFGTAGVVEAENTELDIGNRIPENLVLRNVQQEGIFLLLQFRICLDLRLQLSVNLDGGRVSTTGAAMVCRDLLLLLYHERLVTGLDAHPTLVRPRSLFELVVESLAFLRKLLYEGAIGKFLLQGGRLDILPLLDQEALLERDFPHPSDCLRTVGVLKKTASADTA
mmetsp:Transcript_133373/g.285210  ORF Transcript_133373/g.285210 Transcript_133373/m.285210 type:complete len:372 (-) Transcript_133373:2-1117(-)